MTKKLFLATVLMLSLIITGCSTNSTTKPNDSNTTVNQDSNQSKDDSSKTNSSEADSNKDKSKSEETESAEPAKKVEFSIYTEDAQTMEIKKISTVNINADLTLQEKLETLGTELSKQVFNNLPMEIKSIDVVNGKKIATINLKDSNTSKWSDKFQGSTGGQVTSDSLINTFLPVKPDVEWIDGVKFLYNDEAINYEHVPNLSEVQTRN